MQFLSLQPFVPSGEDLNKSAAFFNELGFTELWNAGDYIGFEKDTCRFILQRYTNREFAENFMLTIEVADVDLFHSELKEKALQEKYGIRITEPVDQPYGREVNIIDIAGVCWHFVQPENIRV
jgi:predicted lactoylglutathione lyase